MKHSNWFWGIFFLAAGFFVIACQVGTFAYLGFWSIAATVLLAAVLVSSLPECNFFGITVPIALLYTIYWQPLGWPRVSVWLLLLAAVLVATGLYMIFRPHTHHWTHHFHDHEEIHEGAAENIDGNDILVRASFSESCKYLQADRLRKARLIASFGKLSVYFDQVRLDPAGAVVELNASFGEMVLYLPGSWNVVDRIYTGTGAVNTDEHRSQPDPNAPTVTLTGNVSFGQLKIRYV